MVYSFSQIAKACEKYGIVQNKKNKVIVLFCYQSKRETHTVDTVVAHNIYMNRYSAFCRENSEKIEQYRRHLG